MITENKSKEVRDKKHPLQLAEEMVKEIKFGSILISVQDGKIIQIERNEKYRL